LTEILLRQLSHLAYMANDGHNLSDLKAFQIVSLLDVIKFPADQFLRAAAILSAINEQTRNALPGQIFSDDNRKAIGEQMLVVRNLCKTLGLEFSIQEIDYIVTNRFEHKPLQTSEVSGLVTALARRMIDEVQRQTCAVIPVEDSKYYNQVQLFGEAVGLKFPTAAPDIKAAGNAYATDNPTACVMHCMRVLELGLGALAKRFRVSFHFSNWDKVIGQIEKKIKEIETRKRKPKDWRSDRQFYSEAALHFRFLKDAWRNYVMHVHESYDKASALTVMNHVHEFMAHVAERLG